MPTVNRDAAEEFVNHWNGRGAEKSDTQHFWNELLRNVLKLDTPWLSSFIDYEFDVKGKNKDGNIQTRRADAYIRSRGILIEQKSIDKSLDKAYPTDNWGYETAYEQASWYRNHMAKSTQPDWIITCNFSTFRFYNLDVEVPEDNYTEIQISELPEQIDLFITLFKGADTTLAYKKEELSIEAGQHVSIMYDSISKCYQHLNDNKEIESLNTLLTRVIFLLYAENAELINSMLFSDFCHRDVGTLHHRLKELFKALDTPYEKRNDVYLSPLYDDWPYVDGGLFNDSERGELIIPPLSDEFASALEKASHFNWSKISPTIIGAIFESILNPDNRQSSDNNAQKKGAGFYYTSIRNIHRVIDPLFLDELNRELSEAKAQAKKVPKLGRAALKNLHDKVASIRVLDPCCGSGNFLVESYLSLRRIENQILLLQANDGIIGEDDGDFIRVTTDHFYGIEINDFAVEITKMSLWISEQQALDETMSYLPEISPKRFHYLPLKPIRNITRGNALTCDWNSVIARDMCTYIVGNPPYKGSRKVKETESEELKSIYGGTVDTMDYCAGWFMKAAEYMSANCRAAFLATKSVCEGSQVKPIWQPVFGTGVHIDFAHNAFRCYNEMPGGSNVLCVIVGFSRLDVAKKLFVHVTPEDQNERETNPEFISAYLRDEPNCFINGHARRSISPGAPKMRSGNKPLYGEPLIFKTRDDRDAFIQAEPAAEKYMFPFIGGDEFLTGKPRWILALKDASAEELAQMPLCKERLSEVRKLRLDAGSTDSLRLADRPWQFHVEVPPKRALIIPETSSENRWCVPLGFVSEGSLCSNQTKIILEGSLYHFGVLQSRFFFVWIKNVCGRHDARFRPSVAGYNSFVWPALDDKHERKITHAAKKLLDVRKQYRDISIGDLYTMLNLQFGRNQDAQAVHAQYDFTNLYNAHLKLDKAVEEAYQVEYDGDERQIANHLIELHNKKSALR
ncbi:MAG: N-6 DNA methylase [Coriobacteriales bacterium]|nr:N-6 DNA methylase [Coriobacteriales bacterium]